jgi:hypothetical protein
VASSGSRAKGALKRCWIAPRTRREARESGPGRRCAGARIPPILLWCAFGIGSQFPSRCSSPTALASEREARLAKFTGRPARLSRLVTSSFSRRCPPAPGESCSDARCAPRTFVDQVV